MCLPCLFWCYPLFQCVYKSSTLFIYLVKYCKYCKIFKLCLRPETLFKRGPWHRCFPMNFVKFLKTPFLTEHLCWLFLSFQVFTFKAILPGIRIPNSQTRQFPRSVIEKTLSFRKGIIPLGDYFMLIKKQPFKIFCKIGALKTFAKCSGKLLSRSNFTVYKLIGCRLE